MEKKKYDGKLFINIQNVLKKFWDGKYGKVFIFSVIGSILLSIAGNLFTEPVKSGITSFLSSSDRLKEKGLSVNSEVNDLVNNAMEDIENEQYDRAITQIQGARAYLENNKATTEETAILDGLLGQVYMELDSLQQAASLLEIAVTNSRKKYFAEILSGLYTKKYQRLKNCKDEEKNILFKKKDKITKELINGYYSCVEFSKGLLDKPFLEKCNVNPSTTYLVFIGTNNYVDHAIPSLTYAEKDVERMIQASSINIKNRLEIKHFLGKQATKENIVKYLSELKNIVQPNDRTMFYFSGHGLTVRIADSYKQYLSVYDTQLKSWESTTLAVDWLSKTFASFNLHAPPAIIIDACQNNINDVQHKVAHNRLIAKNNAVMAISAKENTSLYQKLKNNYCVPSSIIDSSIYKENNTLSKNPRPIIVQSTGYNQKSYESEQLAGGLFTHFLVKYLKESTAIDNDNNDIISYGELFGSVQVAMDIYIKQKELEIPLQIIHISTFLGRE